MMIAVFLEELAVLSSILEFINIREEVKRGAGVSEVEIQEIPDMGLIVPKCFQQRYELCLIWVWFACAQPVPFLRAKYLFWYIS